MTIYRMKAGSVLETTWKIDKIFFHGKKEGIY
jgi:hypothetical protein